MKWYLLMIIAAWSAVSLAVDNPSGVKILKKMPESHTLKSGQIVYVENDGRCAANNIIKITGGNKSKGVRRRIECIPRPG